ncbi:MAG: hypothetical protein ABL996_07255 [Micropepsaceae bacterium]
MPYALTYDDARLTHHASPSWSDRVDHVALSFKPLEVRCFTTNTSSAWAPGNSWLILGLFGNLRQTNNCLDWQDDDVVRRRVPELAVPAIPTSSSVNKEAARENLYEVRRLTGFTWDEISDLLGVDRRTLHNWTQGGYVRNANQQRLADLLSVLRYVDRGSVEANRLALSRPNLWGATGLSLLSQGHFYEAQIAIGKGDARRTTASVTEPLAVLRTGPLGIGYFSGTTDLTANESQEPPPQPARSRRVKLKRD